jgi:hypothetical protein
MARRVASDWYPYVPERVRPLGRPLLALSGILAAHRDLELCGIVAAGDHCFAGPDPFGVWRRLIDLDATLVRGETDLALGTLSAERLPDGEASVGVRHAGLAGTVTLSRYRPTGPDDEARLETFLSTASALGEIVCRRLAELPSTAVVSLDGRAGVMVTHGSPADAWRALTPDMTEIELIHEVGCTAEDALVVGRDPRGFLREAGEVLVVGAGSVGRSPTVSGRGRRTAHAVLVQEFTDGKVRARTSDIEVPGHARRRDRQRKAG